MMINIHPYHDQLEKLKSKMNQWIDNWPYTRGLQIDINALNQFSIAEFFRIWDQTGIMIWHSSEHPELAKHDR